MYIPWLRRAHNSTIVIDIQGTSQGSPARKTTIGEQNVEIIVEKSRNNTRERMRDYKK